MSKLKINSVVNKTNDGAPTLLRGATIPSGQNLNVVGNVNASGIITASSYDITNINATGIITATSFVGDGSGLTGITAVSASKVYAFNLIFDPNPFQS